MLERIVADLVETVERRYHGKYRGFVVSNEDPARLGRLQLKVPSVLGEDVVTGWAAPCVPYGGAANEGMLFIPERDAGVWVEFEEGDLEFPIWVGSILDQTRRQQRPAQASGGRRRRSERRARDANSQDHQNQKGHTIQFEDAER